MTAFQRERRGRRPNGSERRRPPDMESEGGDDGAADAAVAAEGSAFTAYSGSRARPVSGRTHQASRAFLPPWHGAPQLASSACISRTRPGRLVNLAADGTLDAPRLRLGGSHRGHRARVTREDLGC